MDNTPLQLESFANGIIGFLLAVLIMQLVFFYFSSGKRRSPHFVIGGVFGLLGVILIVIFDVKWLYPERYNYYLSLENILMFLTAYYFSVGYREFLIGVSRADLLKKKLNTEYGAEPILLVLGICCSIIPLIISSTELKYLNELLKFALLIFWVHKTQSFNYKTTKALKVKNLYRPYLISVGSLVFIFFPILFNQVGFAFPPIFKFYLTASASLFYALFFGFINAKLNATLIKNRTLLYLELEAKQEFLQTQTLLLEKQVKERTQELDKLNQKKNQLLAIIGHDLRTPFSELFYVLETLERENNHKSLSSAKQKIQFLYNTLESLLQWTSMQIRRDVDNQPQLISIKDALEESIVIFDSLLLKKNISVMYQTIPASMKVRFSENQFQVILRNIMSNAIKYSKPNQKIVITASSSDNNILLIIQDFGIGMNQDILKKIFQKTSSRPGTINETGTGLGLMFVKDILLANGGDVQITSEVEKGTTIVLYLK